MSYLEIYNEDITDLLNPENTKLKIHEDIERGIFVGGIKEEIVSTASQVLAILQKGEVNRKVGQTNMSEASSRSHSIFRISITSRSDEPEEDGETPKRKGKRGSSLLGGSMIVSSLNLVDLAGSERISHTGAEGVRLKEGAHINKSLFTLERVIKKLSDPKSGGGHIPYRDSKLTRMLQSALGGNSKTAIICTMTPSIVYVEESQMTLKFASSAKNIVTRPQVNEICKTKSIKQKYEKKISSLQDQISLLMSQLGGNKEAELLRLLKDARHQLGQKDKEISTHARKRRKIEKNRRMTWSHEDKENIDESSENVRIVKKDFFDIGQLSKELNQAKEEIENLRNEANMRETEGIIVDQEALKVMEQELEKSKEMIQQLAKEKEAFATLKENQEHYIEDIQKKNEKISELEQLNEEEIDVSNQLIEELDFFNNECIKMIESNIKHEEDRQYYEKTIADLEKELLNKADLHREANQQLQDKVCQLDQLTDQINALEVERDDFKDKCKDYETKIDQLVNELVQLKEIKEHLQDEVEHLKDELTHLRSEMEESSEVAEMEELLISEIEQLNQSNIELETKVRDLQAKLTTFDERGETIRKLEDQLEVLKGKVSNMEIEQWDGENKVTLSEMETIQLQDLLAASKTETNSLTQKMEETENTIDSLKDKALDLEYHNEELKTLKRLADEKVLKLTESKKNIKAELEEKTLLLQILKEEKDSLIAEWTVEKEKLFREFEEQKEQYSSLLKQEKDDLLLQLEEEKINTQLALEEKESIRLQMEEKEQTLIQMMEERESALHVIIEEKDIAIKDIEDENEQLEKQLIELDAIREELKNMKSIETEMLQLKTLHEDDKTKISSMEIENKELTVMVEELLAKSETLSSEKEELVKTIENKDSESQDKKELEELKEAVEHYKSVIDDYNKMFEEQGKKLENLESMEMQLAKYKLYAKRKRDDELKIKKAFEEQKKRFDELRKEAEKVRDENIRLSKSRLTIVDKENVNPLTNKPVNI